MRVGNFFLYTASVSSNGNLSNIDISTLSEPAIKDGDIVVSCLTLSGTTATSNDPYGNVNVFVDSGRSVNNGSITGLSFAKSNTSIGTTDLGDIILIAAR